VSTTTPTYDSANTRVAYQLNWSYSVFWHTRPLHYDWFPALQAAMEPDGIRLLKHRFQPPHTSQFLISTLPDVAPQLVAQRTKGRLQYLIRAEMPDAFRRNYAIRSIGSTKRDKVEAYIAAQLGHHRFADERVEARFVQYQFQDATVDLSAPQGTTHARYWYNLHLVFVMHDRDRHFLDETLAAICQMTRKAAAKKGHRLSRAGILPDHVHLSLGCLLHETPEAVALSYMNNLAYAAGTRLFEYGYWVGTFGEYDLGAI
jgi:REP element-mobilizing transposase RayT